MTQEIKKRLEQEAQKMSVPRHPKSPTMRGIFEDGFLQCAQIILENPEEWGLVRQGSFNKKEFFRKAWRERARKAESQLTKYRQALERIVKITAKNNTRVKAREITKEALKQEDATCPKCGYPLFKHLGKTCCQGCDYVKQQ